MGDWTPGPWRVGNHPESRRADAVFAGDRKVAYCQSLFGRPHAGYEEFETNARLIAAAPCMYAMLERAWPEINDAKMRGEVAALLRHARGETTDQGDN